MSTAVNKYDVLKSNDDSGEEDSGSRDMKDKPLPQVEVKPGEHPLQYTYSLWFSRRAPGKQATTQNYDQNLQLLARFASVEQFWGYYSRCLRPVDLPSHSDIHIFKDGIKPMWEDSANKNGGKWIVRLRKGLASRCWENMILAMLGEQFMVGDEICGAVISVRFQEDIISVWNRTAQDSITTGKIRDTLKRVLNLPPTTVMEYKTHNDSLKHTHSASSLLRKPGLPMRHDLLH
ncbi:eukaryotic translation initiation factor 4E type 2-like isoform X1 [Penaeus monodon]|uniref:eukaryotic translation initiation factor 4E type 2-like isoform X1 n=1 Tax=Penaeus monodon TaxID=6687 RepID=UPI0018A787CF|nr:eukaryotic translation initiation factor 4E type 2-like isoform X1 [Penaeus monodon]XP_037782942.1 eukaryotic translation initiation factor 4E type 2-like isoform X1 [Penaeus monodon]